MDTKDSAIAPSLPAADGGVGNLPTDAQRLLRRLGMTAVVAFGFVRRTLTRPARLFHNKNEADRVRDQHATQRLNARHFRGM